MRILIAEKSSTTRRMIHNVLTSAGITEVTETSDGSDALQLLTHEPFGVLIVGSDLASLSGVEFTTQMRKMPLYEKAPVLYLTAHSTHEDVLDAMEAGVDTYILLPFQDDDFTDKVRTALLRAQQLEQQRLQQQAAKPKHLPVKKGYTRRRFVGS